MWSRKILVVELEDVVDLDLPVLFLEVRLCLAKMEFDFSALIWSLQRFSQI